MFNWQQTWGNSVDVFANTGIQFMDFQFDENLAVDFGSAFVEIPSTDGNQLLQKFEAGKIPQGSPYYEFSFADVSKIYLNQWIPVPCFAHEGPNQNSGPYNWVRARLSKTSEEKTNLQIAIDTTVTARSSVENYQQPSLDDATVNREFAFISDFAGISKLLKDGCDDPSTFQFDDKSAWVSEWMKANYRCLDEDQVVINQKSKLEVWASYIAFVELLSKVVNFPHIKLRPSPYSHNDASKIDVDLVLDIGNSRTCGLILEIPDGNAIQGLAIEDVSQLALRNLTEPSIVHTGLFESRVEFASVSFGSDLFSRQSGRNNAFLWPSFVRFGPEAISLMSSDKGNESFSGLSSPKRYLWDNNVFEHKWRFHNSENEQKLPRNLMAMLPELTVEGECEEQIQEEIQKRLRSRNAVTNLQKASAAHFSKSSLYGFMIIEIIAQAFRQINDAEYRGNKMNKSVPRFLRNVIITLPTATPKQEQAIVKSRVRGAIKLLWSRMSKSGQVLPQTAPKDNVEWDEASCTQIMYLYSEIMEKYNKDIGTYLKTFGKERTSPEGSIEKSIRLACIDIGGGTTDLMVTTYFQQYGVQLTPNQEFREGFRKAGDDLLCSIIELLIIPKLSLELKKIGESATVDSILMNCFGKSVAGMTASRKHVRRQFTLKILAPLALEILKKDFTTETSVASVKFSDIANKVAALSVKDYFDKDVKSRVSGEWSIENFEICFTQQELSSIIEQTFKLIFENISEVLERLDVDFIILTGRPSQNKQVVELFKNCTSHSPKRIVSLSRYRAGTWYPFRSANNTVGDPKSTVAVGAMLIAVAGSRRLSNLFIPSNKFNMVSTDKFIGKIQNIGRIQDDDVFFSGDNNGCSITLMTDTYVGSRQLKTQRWTATPLYKLYFIDATDGALPYTLELERGDNVDDDALYEPIEIKSATDASKRNKKSNVGIKLQTLGENEEYWLDSGAFEV